MYSKKTKTLVIIGVVVGAVATVTAITAGAIAIYKYCKSKAMYVCECCCLKEECRCGGKFAHVCDSKKECKLGGIEEFSPEDFEIEN